jgi:hypothetical protein
MSSRSATITSSGGVKGERWDPLRDLRDGARDLLELAEPVHDLFAARCLQAFGWLNLLRLAAGERAVDCAHVIAHELDPFRTHRSPPVVSVREGTPVVDAGNTTET